MTERWFRWYDGTTRDGKFRIVAEISELPVCTILGIWASLLEDAATSEPRGIASRGLDHHSMYLGIAAHEIGTVWNALERCGTLRNIGNGGGTADRIEIINWDKRQFESDAKDPTAKERKTRWKQSHKENGTVRNAQERNGTARNTIDRDIDIDRKKETPRLAPGDFEPLETHFELGGRKGLSREQVRETAAEMVDWSIGNGKKRRDWNRAFNNWLRRSATGSRRSGGNQSLKEKMSDVLQQLGSGSFGQDLDPGLPKRIGK